jgi:hypothetical protein
MKEILTSAVLAQTQQDSLATIDQDEALPAQLIRKLKIQSNRSNQSQKWKDFWRALNLFLPWWYWLLPQNLA